MFEKMPKGIRAASALQKLASERNYSAYHQVSMMIGHLRLMKRRWHSVEVEKAIAALEEIRLQVDMAWERERTALLRSEK